MLRTFGPRQEFEAHDERFLFLALSNLWISAADGVHGYAADGCLLGEIKIPEPVSNLCFGGPRRNQLFITATSSLYSVYVAVKGAQKP